MVVEAVAEDRGDRGDPATGEVAPCSLSEVGRSDTSLGVPDLGVDERSTSFKDSEREAEGERESASSVKMRGVAGKE